MYNKKFVIISLILSLVMILSSCAIVRIESKYNKKVITFSDEATEESKETEKIADEEELVLDADNGILEKENTRKCVILDIVLNGEEEYYDMSMIKDGHAYLYVASDSNLKKNFTVTINAGHGVKGGSSVKTYSHPDMTPKLSGGTNAKGEIMSLAISEGTSFVDGEYESVANLKVAVALRDALLDFGYNVLMIREDENNRFDNVARAILANEHSDMHISLHFDSTEEDKGAFVILPLHDEEYISMEPVKSHYQKSDLLGQCFIEAFKENNEKVWKNGIMRMDLTQISYSKVPTVDIELGDKATDHSDYRLATFVPSLMYGIEKYYYKKK